MSDLDIIAQIDEKIHQLPVEFLSKVDDYVNSLLQEYRDTSQVVKKRSEQPFIGMWQDREDMQDVESYVRQLRKPRY
jgi:hypothetical protein